MDHRRPLQVHRQMVMSCKQVEPLLDRIHKYIVDLPNKGIIPILEADKGYDAESLRDKLLRIKVFHWICRRKKPGKEAEKVETVLKRMRWKVERAISWLQKKFRRLAVRWERRVCYWKGFFGPKPYSFFGSTD